MPFGDQPESAKQPSWTKTLSQWWYGLFRSMPLSTITPKKGSFIHKPVSNVRKPAWYTKTFAGFLSIFIPIGAAVGKAIGNAFGALCLALLFSEGIVSSSGIGLEMLTIPVLVFAGLCFLGVTAISLGMEGFKNWKALYARLLKWLTGQEPAPEPTLSPEEKEQQQKQRAKSNFFKKILGFLLAPFAYLIPPLGAIAKGSTMAFGMYVTLGMLVGVTISTGPAGWVVLGFALLAGVAVAFVSLAKEGKDTFKKIRTMINYVMGVDDDSNKKTTFDRVNQFIASIVKAIFKAILFAIMKITFLDLAAKTRIGKEILSWIFPVLAAIGKGFGNAFGMVKIVGFLSGLALISPWNIPIIIMFGLCEFAVSMVFEGNELRTHSKNAINGTLNIDDSTDKKDSVLLKWLGAQLAKAWMPIRYILGYGVPLLAALSKGATMGFGTFTTLGLLGKIGLVLIPLSFTTPAGIAVMSAIIFVSVCVVLVSLTKEGKEFINWATTSPRSDVTKQTTAKVEEEQALLSESVGADIEQALDVDIVQASDHASVVQQSNHGDGVKIPPLASGMTPGDGDFLPLASEVTPGADDFPPLVLNTTGKPAEKDTMRAAVIEILVSTSSSAMNCTPSQSQLLAIHQTHNATAAAQQSKVQNDSELINRLGNETGYRFTLLSKKRTDSRTAQSGLVTTLGQFTQTPTSDILPGTLKRSASCGKFN